MYHKRSSISNYKDINPSELVLKKESISNSEASFLDLSIVIEINNTKLFDKRDASPFSIVCVPHLDSYISSSIYNAFIGSQTLRFAGTTSDKNTFTSLANQLIYLC